MTLKRAWDDTYPDEQCPIFDVRDYVVLPGVLKARLYDNVPARHDFLDFVVRNWSQIMAARFGWMRQPPPSRPALRFICQRAFVTTLLDAYADRRHWDQIRMLPAEEQELARLMEGGMGREEAIAKVAEHRALSKMRDEKADVGRHNADMTRQAEAARKKLNDDRRAFMREKAIASCETRPRTAPSRIGHQHAKPRTPVSEPPRRPAVPIAPVDDFANLPPIDLPELPPFDPAAWN
jgi:hypothetical protein